ncbi:hypothetical protein BH23GEM2_BH23GEM2_03380 [soil metagenome]
MHIALFLSAFGMWFALQSATDPETNLPRTVYREVYDYDAGGRRDPFASLIGTGDIRPIFNDLRVTSILFDPSGNSVAVLRDLTSREQYRVRTGQSIGRLRVVAIRQRSVTFAIEEFGYSRQETLTIGDTANTRTP